MNNWKEILDTFLLQAQKSDLKTSSYPKEFSDLKMKVSFGMGVSARVPWIALTAPEMQVSKGFYPVYLYYKEEDILILAYGISETSEYSKTWSEEIISSSSTIRAYFDKKVPRYGDSYVFKAYSINIDNDDIEYYRPDEDKTLSAIDIESDLNIILNNYKKIVSDGGYYGGYYYNRSHIAQIRKEEMQNEINKFNNLLIESGFLKSAISIGKEMNGLSLKEAFEKIIAQEERKIEMVITLGLLLQ